MKIIKKKNKIIEEILLKFKTYIYYYYLIFDITSNIEKYKKIHKEITDTFTFEYGSIKRKESIDNIYKYYTNGSLKKLMSIILMRDSVLPDLYILARSYKYMYTTVNPKHGLVYPMINICYFGCEHSKRMYQFLIDNGYKNVINIDNDVNVDVEPSRCIDLTEHDVDLNKMINQLKKKRSEAKSGGKPKRRT